MTREELEKANKLNSNIEWFEDMVKKFEDEFVLIDIRFHILENSMPELRGITLNLMRQKLEEYKKELEEM